MLNLRRLAVVEGVADGGCETGPVQHLQVARRPGGSGKVRRAWRRGQSDGEGAGRRRRDRDRGARRVRAVFAPDSTAAGCRAAGKTDQHQRRPEDDQRRAGGEQTGFSKFHVSVSVLPRCREAQLFWPASHRLADDRIGRIPLRGIDCPRRSHPQPALH